MKLTDDDVREILTASRSGASLARRFGKSRQAISQIRLGITYAEVAPEIPRRSRSKSCRGCRFWRDGVDPCSQGVLDVIKEGPSFAADCEFFEPRAE
jgi:hypothetical protein